jgi:soluble lytic murein transglycosylase-like protein
LHRSCFWLVWGVALAAGSLWAADTPSVAGNQPVRMTSVVRSDQRTGKLVRSVVVNPKPVAEHKVAETVVVPRAVSSLPAPGPASPVRAAVSLALPTGSIDEMVAQVAARESLPPQLIHSVIKVESNYDPNAVSPKGALGLMQLIPATARRFGVNNVFNPADNIQGGAKYLRYLLELFKGDYPRALAAYNAGEGAVTRYGGVPPYPETRNYLVQVGRQLEKNMAGQSRPEPVEAAPAAKPDAAPPDGVSHLREIVQPDGTVRYVSK